MDSRCYQIGWNMAADDMEPLPAWRLSRLAEDVAKQEYPDVTDEQRLFHGNRFMNGYDDCFARRTGWAQGKARF